MPCRDYDYSSSHSDGVRERELLEQNNRLARIACKVMKELVKNEVADFILLKDDEVREWWEKHQEDDRKEALARREKARKAKLAREEKARNDAIRREALFKLTAEEKKILGIKE